MIEIKLKKDTKELSLLNRKQELVLEQVGRKGQQGERGIQGIQGKDGKDGKQGKDGEQGPQGPQGPKGADGAKGSTGPQGPQGPIGPEGPQGKDGTQGPQGPQGPEGPQGKDGTQGPQGPQGPEGPQGTTDYNQLENLPTLFTKNEADDLYATKCRNTLIVPSDDYPTIASATAVASAGDLILLKPQTYNEKVVLPDGVDLDGGRCVEEGDHATISVTGTNDDAITVTGVHTIANLEVRATGANAKAINDTIDSDSEVTINDCTLFGALDTIANFNGSVWRLNRCSLGADYDGGNIGGDVFYNECIFNFVFKRNAERSVVNLQDGSVTFFNCIGRISQSGIYNDISLVRGFGEIFEYNSNITIDAPNCKLYRFKQTSGFDELYIESYDSNVFLNTNIEKIDVKGLGDCRLSYKGGNFLTFVDVDVNKLEQSEDILYAKARTDNEHYVTSSEKITLSNTSGVNTGDQYLGDLLNTDQTVPQTVTGTLTLPSLNVDSGTLYVDPTKHWVGIGTTTPGAPLQVKGTATGTLGFANFTNTAASGTGGGGGVFLASDDGSAVDNNDRLGYLIFAGSTSHNTTANAVGIVGYADENWTTSTNKSRLSFEVCPPNSNRVEYMRLSSNQFRVSTTTLVADLINDRVGVGTTSPYVKFEVVDGTSGQEKQIVQYRTPYTGVGSGTAIRWVASSASNSTFGAGEISVIRTNAVGNGDSDMIFRLSPSGAFTEYLRIKSDKTFKFISGMKFDLGAGTQTVPTGSTLDTLITALQNLGLIKQS